MRFVLALLLALAALPAAAQEIDHAALARRALDDHIRPGYARLAEAARGLDAATRTACEAPGPIDVAPVRAAYDATFDAWARIGHIRFGPGEENGTVFGIEFWPDTKASTPRTLAALVADENPAVDDPAAFAGQSVAARGLMAIDQLLFDPAADAHRGRHLPLPPPRRHHHRPRRHRRPPRRPLATTPGPASSPPPAPPTTRSTSPPTRRRRPSTPPSPRACRWTSTSASAARSAPGTSPSPAAPRPGAPAARSPTSSPRPRACAPSSRPSSSPRSAPTRPRPVLDAFDAALAAAGRVAAPIDVEVATPQGRIHVEALQVALRHVQEEVASHVGPTIGVTSGFNSMDGD